MFQWDNYQFIVAYCNLTVSHTTKGGNQQNIMRLSFTFILFFMRGSLGR